MIAWNLFLSRISLSVTLDENIDPIFEFIVCDLLMLLSVWRALTSVVQSSRALIFHWKREDPVWATALKRKLHNAD